MKTILRRRLVLGLVCLVTFLTPQRASANTVLTYTGYNYLSDFTYGLYTTDMFMSVKLELADELEANYTGYLTPLHFEFNDGIFLINDENPYILGSQFWVKTDGTGAIQEWSNGVTLQNVPDFTLVLRNEYQTYNPFRNLRYQFDGARYNFGESFSGYVRYDSGTPAENWGIDNYPDTTPPVPEPGSSLSLLVGGLAASGFLSRKRIA